MPRRCPAFPWGELPGRITRALCPLEELAPPHTASSRCRKRPVELTCSQESASRVTTMFPFTEEAVVNGAAHHSLSASSVPSLGSNGRRAPPGAAWPGPRQPDSRWGCSRVTPSLIPKGKVAASERRCRCGGGGPDTAPARLAPPPGGARPEARTHPGRLRRGRSRDLPPPPPPPAST